MTSAHDPIEISVVAPVYNEQECVEEFVRRTDEALRAIGVPYEIVVASDGSTDRTNELLRAAAQQYPALVVLILARNVGQCSALYAAIQATRGRAIIVTDGDLQHRPEDMVLLYEKLNEGYTLVSGNRGGRKEGPSKRIPSRIANWLLRQVTGSDVKDMGGFKAIEGDMARSLRLRPGHHRLLPALVHMRGGSTGQIWVEHQARFAGKSHYGIGRTFDVIFDILMLGFQASFKARPLYLFGRIGVLLLLVDCIIMPWLLWEKFMDGVSMGTRPPFLVAIMFFLAALFFLAMGFVLELLTDANSSISGTKPYVVREKIGGSRA
ncbi:MAG: hypothetical protein RL136_125 [Planctomycetota bacterium]|jgi:glycosyltransferase involved in cell wall biosynthesis